MAYTGGLKQGCPSGEIPPRPRGSLSRPPAAATQHRTAQFSRQHIHHHRRATHRVAHADAATPTLYIISAEALACLACPPEAWCATVRYKEWSVAVRPATGNPRRPEALPNSTRSWIVPPPSKISSTAAHTAGPTTHCHSRQQASELQLSARCCCWGIGRCQRRCRAIHRQLGRDHLVAPVAIAPASTVKVSGGGRWRRRAGWRVGGWLGVGGCGGKERRGRRWWAGARLVDARTLEEDEGL